MDARKDLVELYRKSGKDHRNEHNLKALFQKSMTMRTHMIHLDDTLQHLCDQFPMIKVAKYVRAVFLFKFFDKHLLLTSF